jgi:putative tricarboxylic transport membrane protein
MTATSKADFWFSLILIVFGGAAVFESWRMPRLENLGIDPLSAPGLTPGLIGLVVTGLGLALMARSLRSPAVGKSEGAPRGWGRFSVTLALCFVYAVGLVGWLPFWAATGLFVFAFVTVFTWVGEIRLRQILFALILAAIVATTVMLLFERVFLIRLP